MDVRYFELERGAESSHLREGVGGCRADIWGCRHGPRVTFQFCVTASTQSVAIFATLRREHLRGTPRGGSTRSDRGSDVPSCARRLSVPRAVPTDFRGPALPC